MESRFSFDRNQYNPGGPQKAPGQNILLRYTLLLRYGPKILFFKFHEREEGNFTIIYEWADIQIYLFRIPSKSSNSVRKVIGIALSLGFGTYLFLSKIGWEQNALLQYQVQILVISPILDILQHQIEVLVSSIGKYKKFILCHINICKKYENWSHTEEMLVD